VSLSNNRITSGDRLVEANHINTSLSALGSVMAALASKSRHVPFRDSKLTQLLADSLSGAAKVMMFVHVAPEASSYQETSSTLKFAERVAAITLGEVRVKPSSSIPCTSSTGLHLQMTMMPISNAPELFPCTFTIECAKGMAAVRVWAPPQAKKNAESGEVYRSHEEISRLRGSCEQRDAEVGRLVALLQEERSVGAALAAKVTRLEEALAAAQQHQQQGAYGGAPGPAHRVRHAEKAVCVCLWGGGVSTGRDLLARVVFVGLRVVALSV
jgi:hypothetical protein